MTKDTIDGCNVFLAGPAGPDRRARSAGAVAPAGPAGADGRARVRVVMLFVTLLEAWQQRHRQRIALSEMPDHMLRDIGLSRADAYGESRKPFWRY